MMKYGSGGKSMSGGGRKKMRGYDNGAPARQTASTTTKVSYGSAKSGYTAMTPAGMKKGMKRGK